MRKNRYLTGVLNKDSALFISVKHSGLIIPSRLNDQLSGNLTLLFRSSLSSFSEKSDIVLKSVSSSLRNISLQDPQGYSDGSPLKPAITEFLSIYAAVSRMSSSFLSGMMETGNRFRNFGMPYLCDIHLPVSSLYLSMNFRQPFLLFHNKFALGRFHISLHCAIFRSVCIKGKIHHRKSHVYYEQHSMMSKS